VRKKTSAKKATPQKRSPARKTTKPAAKSPRTGPAKAKPKAAAKTKAKPKSAAKAPKHALARADYGAPIDGFFAKQPPTLRPILEKLRSMVEKAAPDAESSLKWGMPCYTIDGAMMCALGAHKAHVNLILAGPADSFADPKGMLAGGGKTGRHLKLTSLEELPVAAVRGWLDTAARGARSAGRKLRE